MGLCSFACNSSGSGDGDCHKCVESSFPDHIPVLCIAGNCLQTSDRKEGI